MKTETRFLPSAITIFRQYKTLADKAIHQLTEKELRIKLDEESNSVYLIMKHISGNMLSRWTDFLNTDGEKEWRNRDTEFEDDSLSIEDIFANWEKGWSCLFQALEPLDEKDLARIVTIRGEEHSVLEAVNRQIAHYSYHVGQIVFVAKVLRASQWKTLSIAKGESALFNRQYKPT